MVSGDAIWPGGNPLASPLTHEQSKLLMFIWESVTETAHTQATPHWPVWDFVARSMYIAFPDLEDAETVYRSLPVIGFDPFGSEPYGFVWCGDPSITRMRPDVKVGLTIAGIHHVEQVRHAPVRVSEELVTLIASLAEAEGSLQPNPASAVTKQVQLAQYTSWLVARDQKRFVVTDEMTSQLLLHEPARVVIVGTSVHLEGYWLRPYRNTPSVARYLDTVFARSQSVSKVRPEESALTLIQTLDYLSLVVEKEKPWKPARSSPVEWCNRFVILQGCGG